VAEENKDKKDENKTSSAAPDKSNENKDAGVTTQVQPNVTTDTVDLTADAVPAGAPASNVVDAEAFKAALDANEDGEPEFITISNKAGGTKVVRKADFDKLSDDPYSKLKAVDPEDVPNVATDLKTTLLLNDTYIAAHGPANPVRNHVAIPELEHVGIVREAIKEKLGVE